MSEEPAPYTAHTPSPIRFRVFDPATGEMHYPDDASDRHTLYPDGSFEHPADRGCIPLLSTGLRDAEGVEVFDGDYLRDTLNPNIPPASVYRQGACFGTDYVWPLPDDLERYECVGNVYTGLREPA